MTLNYFKWKWQNYKIPLANQMRNAAEVRWIGQIWLEHRGEKPLRLALFWLHWINFAVVLQCSIIRPISSKKQVIFNLFTLTFYLVDSQIKLRLQFSTVGSNLSPNMSAIVVGVIQIVGSYIATLLVERAGRKFLFVVSTIGTAFGLITLGVYMMLASWKFNVEVYNWIPLAAFSFSIFIASWAVLTLPFLVISGILKSVFLKNCKINNIYKLIL